MCQNFRASGATYLMYWLFCRGGTENNVIFCAMYLPYSIYFDHAQGLCPFLQKICRFRAKIADGLVWFCFYLISWPFGFFCLKSCGNPACCFGDFPDQVKSDSSMKYRTMTNWIPTLNRYLERVQNSTWSSKFLRKFVASLKNFRRFSGIFCCSKWRPMAMIQAVFAPTEVCS